MNDYQYTFVQDSREKKNIAHSAAKKVNGSKSKKCTLPGDYLTTAQKKKLSKTLVDVNLREPMTWESFKNLRSEIKREYLEFLKSRYHANANRIGVDMFGLSPAYLTGYIRKHHPELCDIFSDRGQSVKMIKEELTVWHTFLGTSVSDDEKSSVVVEKNEKFHTYKINDEKDDPPSEPEKLETVVDLDPSSLSMAFDKTCSYEDICQKLRFILMAQANGRNVTQFEFTVKFE